MNSASVVALIYEHLGRQDREELTRLARLVEAACAAQREECAKLCEQIATQHLSSGRYMSVVADHSSYCNESEQREVKQLSFIGHDESAGA